MKVESLFAQKPCVFSIECFPPKQTANVAKMKETLGHMQALHPDFMSVTYGAGGSAGGASTVEIADYLKNTLGVEPLAHLICMGADKASAQNTLGALAHAGVENVLALRGDETPNRPKSPDFAHASDLMDFLRAQTPAFFYAGACYPEGHPESATPAVDLEGLLQKQQAGAGFLVSQLFFDNAKFYRFLNRARKAGLKLPVSAGVMPIVKKSQIERTVALSSASLPSEFTRMIARYQNDEQALFDAGIDYAVRQMRDLIEGGADGVHLYAMNSFAVAEKVYDGIRDLL
ncbi:MAG: methylenetetrahydrofolate reductase [Faecalibacterium sp.]|jgi:methylenetetrahydrofolate reductase (NADPH)|nr:methylenetetrahydrofolate reductase [Faecalibacterium sp.]